MPQTISGATAALITKLKAIQGAASGHKTNLGGRVYTRLVLPEDAGAGEDKPYLCLPKYEDGPTYAWYDRHVEIRWRQPIHGFVPEEATDDRNSKSPKLVEDLMEDVIESILKDRELGGAAKEITIGAGGGAIAGVDPEDRWAEFLMWADLLILHDAGSLA